MSRSVQSKQLQDFTPEQKAALLRDEDGNNVPDVLEQGVLPEEMGVAAGSSFDGRSRDFQKSLIKFFAKFVRVNDLRKQMEGREPQSYESALENSARNRIKRYLPFIVVVDLIIIGLVVYYLTR